MYKQLVLLCCVLALATAASVPKYSGAIHPSDLPVKEDNSILGRIVGGTAAAANQIPYQVWIRSYVGVNSITCGGSLIAQNWVLTAAHCVQGYSSFLVGAGSNNINNPLVQVNATTAIVHPSFNPSNYNNDIALIQLPLSLPISASLATIRLPAVSQTNTTFLNFQTTVSGFGRTTQNSTVLSTTLQYVNMRVIANTVCANIYGSAVVIPSVACGEGWTSLIQGACGGDSGGPMAISETGVNTLIGVVSFISGNGCGFGDPTGFTRVASYLNWINAITGIALRP